MPQLTIHLSLLSHLANMFYAVVYPASLVFQSTAVRALAILGALTLLCAQFVLHGAGFLDSAAASPATVEGGALLGLDALATLNPLPPIAAAAGLQYVEFVSVLGLGIVALRALDDWQFDLRTFAASPRRRPLHVTLWQRASPRAPEPIAGDRVG